MSLSRYFYSIFLIAALRSAVCTPLSRALPESETGAFGPSLPPDTEYVPFDGVGVGLSLAIDKYDDLFLTYDECKANASLRGAHMWFHDETNDRCFFATLVHPVCSSYQGNQSGGFILEDYLSDGSPSDNAVLDPERIGDLLGQDCHVSFRVETPTILQLEGFTQRIGFPWSRYEQENKMVIFPNDGSVVATDSRILVDPACHTNSSCGVPFLTSSVGLNSLPRVIMLDVCEQIIELRKGEGITMFSHAGTGCEFFPDPYPESRCFVIVKGHGVLKIDVTLVDFQEADCDGFQFWALASDTNTTRTSYDLCNKNNSTEFSSAHGRVRFFFRNTKSAQTFQKYGFIINVLNMGRLEDPVFSIPA